jgi:uncharacterized membrane protein YadS
LVTSKEGIMAEIVKFIRVMMIFLFLFLVAINIDGRRFVLDGNGRPLFILSIFVPYFINNLIFPF